MNSTTTLVAKQCRLETWAKQIQDCNQRPQGMSVKDWCSQQGVNVASYYYRLTQVRKACLDNIPSSDAMQDIVAVPNELLANSQQTSKQSGLNISVNQIKIHVTNDTSPDLLRMVLEVAANVK